MERRCKLCKKIERLQKKVDSMESFQESEKQRVQKGTVENGRLNKQIEELRRKIADLRQAHVSQA